MAIASVTDTLDYVLDMLDQLSRMAKRDGLEHLANRIERVVTAERREAEMVQPQATVAPPKSGQA